MNHKQQNIFISNNDGTILFMTLLILTTMLTVILVAANLVMAGLIMSRTQENSTISYAAAEAGAERVLWEIRVNNDSEDLMRDYDPGCTVDCICVEGDYINFNPDNDDDNIAECVNDINSCGDGTVSCEYSLPNNPEAKYIVIYRKEGDDTIFTSKGIYRGLNRSVEVGFTKKEDPTTSCDIGYWCIDLPCQDDPDTICTEKGALYPESCVLCDNNEQCPSKCLYQPGCATANPDEATVEEVPSSTGYCCLEQPGDIPQQCYRCKSGLAWDDFAVPDPACCEVTCDTEAGCHDALGNADPYPAGGDCCHSGDCYKCKTAYEYNTDTEVCDCVGNCDADIDGILGCYDSGSEPAHTENSGDVCCESQICYQCKPGFHEDTGQCVLDNTNLIAWWKMDDDPNDGDGVLDSAGGYNGTNSVIGATLVDGSFPGNCKSGNCLNFDGDDNNVNVSNIWGELIGDCKRYGTIATWFWWDDIDFDQNRHIFQFKRDDNNMLRMLYDTGSDMWRVEYVGNASSKTIDIPRTSGLVKSGKWNHLVMTWDDDDGDTEADLIFYINGEAVGSQPSIDNFLGFLSGSVCKLGSKSADAQYLLGRLDEFRVYCSRTLNAVEVAALCEFDNGVDCCELRGPGACP